MIAALFAIIVFQLLGEKVPLNGGAMGDGIFYRDIATDFLGNIEDESYNLAQMQRVMPFAVLNVVFSVFEWTKDSEGLLRGMLIFNLLMAGLGVYWYFAMAEKLRLRDNLSILGFVLLFANFAVLKDIWYHPFNPSFTAMMLGIGQANYFVRVERQKLFLLSLVAGFVWPTMLLTGLALMLMPSEKMLLHEGDRPKSIYPFVVTGAVFLILILAGLWTERFEVEGRDLVLYLLSIAAMLIYFLAFLVKNPIQWKLSWFLFRKKLKPEKARNFWLILGSFALILFLLSGTNDNIGFRASLVNYMQEILRFPLDFLVGHTMYFGFLVPLAMVFFPRMMKEMANLGMGFTLVCSLMFVFVLHPEPQFLMPFFPFLVLLILKSVKRYRILTKDILVVAGANLLLSAAWLPLNPLGTEIPLIGGNPTGSLGIPGQRYWMHFGHMMSWEVFIWAAVAFTLLIWLAWKGKMRYKREFVLSRQTQTP